MNLFEELLAALPDDLDSDTSSSSSIPSTCTHDGIIRTESGMYICTYCQHTVDPQLVDNKGWKDLFSNSKMCYSVRKSSHASIFDELDQSHLFSVRVMEQANTLFSLMSQMRQGMRGKSRKAIAFASIYYACNQNSFPVSIERLCTMLNVTRKQAICGIKFFTNYLPVEYKYLLDLHEDTCIMNDLFETMRSSEAEMDRVRDIYGKLSACSNVCSRSRIRSVIVAIMYLVRYEANNLMDRHDFYRQTCMSELTVQKIYVAIRHIVTELFE